MVFTDDDLVFNSFPIGLDGISITKDGGYAEVTLAFSKLVLSLILTFGISESDRMDDIAPL